MGLKHLKLASEEIEFAGGKFAVRGLNFEDITIIVRQNAAPLAVLFEKIQSGDTNVSLEDAASIASSMAASAPEAVATIIALASEPAPSIAWVVDPEDLEAARKLPFPVQIEALEKIGRLTFATEGGPKKVLETIIRVANGTSATIADLRRA